MISPVLRLLPLLLLAVPARAQVPGAVFALDRFGSHLQGNSFPRKDGVFLSGGPRGACTSAGLPDGTWCFQITDPAGSTLLTTDPIGERSVRVVGGVISQYLGTTRASAFVGPCGALNVRLAPFAVSPYPIGEYKIWLTRIEDYDPQGSNLFGFDPARSKSDNFRVNPGAPQTILRGHKFYDYDDSGTWNPVQEPLEVPIGGWRVEIYRNNVLDGVTYTDQDGWYQFIRDRDSSTLEIRESSPNGFVNDATPGATWLATTARTGTATTTAEYVAGPEFGNVSYELTPLVGRTPEFWSQIHEGPDSGRGLLQECDPDWRYALNMRDGVPVNLRKPISNDTPSISVFTVPIGSHNFSSAYAQWRTYVNRNGHDHAGYLLSREVAATLLSLSCGYMDGDILIDRHGDGVLVSLDQMIIDVIGLLSEVGAGLTGPNDPYQDLRHMMQMCTNEFGSINNTGSPSAPQIVYTRSQEPGFFASPY